MAVGRRAAVPVSLRELPELLRITDELLAQQRTERELRWTGKSYNRGNGPEGELIMWWAMTEPWGYGGYGPFHMVIWIILGIATVAGVVWRLRSSSW